MSFEFSILRSSFGLLQRCSSAGARLPLRARRGSWCKCEPLPDRAGMTALGVDEHPFGLGLRRELPVGRPREPVPTVRPHATEANELSSTNRVHRLHPTDGVEVTDRDALHPLDGGSVFHVPVPVDCIRGNREFITIDRLCPEARFFILSRFVSSHGLRPGILRASTSTINRVEFRGHSLSFSTFPNRRERFHAGREPIKQGTDERLRSVGRLGEWGGFRRRGFQRGWSRSIRVAAAWPVGYSS